MKRVLVAEDEASIREFIVINLERAGYEVVQAENGQQALNEYTSHDGDFDMVLLDIMMPEMDGIEVCKQLRSMSKNVGIIMLTAKRKRWIRLPVCSSAPMIM
jgi:DNA-binding response OmpR family regulator